MLTNIKTLNTLVSVLSVIFLFSAYIYANDKEELKEKINSKSDVEIIKLIVENQKSAIDTLSKVHTESTNTQSQTNAEFRQAILMLYKKQIEIDAKLQRIEEKIK